MIEKFNKRNVLQLIKFAVVGFSNAIVLFVVYNLLLLAGLNYQIAYAIGFVVSVLNAFFWNNRYVFKSGRAHIINKLFKVYASYIITYFLSAALLYLWVDVLHVMVEIAPIINIIITTPINFLLNKLWAFKNK